MATHQESLEVAEAARQTEWHAPSFVAELFMGHLNARLVFPYPEQEEGDRRIGEEYLGRVEAFLRAHVDPDDLRGLRAFAGQLQSGDFPHRELLRIHRGVAERPSKHRGPATAQVVRHRGAETTVSPSPGDRHGFRVCPDGVWCGI